MLTESSNESIFQLNRAKNKWPELVGLEFNKVLYELQKERPFYEVEKVSFEQQLREYKEQVQPSNTRIRVFVGRNGKAWRVLLA
jgi:hypothetical protein